ncbi:hypothetical protein V6259_05195 [Marinomonas sp. TI.3.20]|uniref:hypothetical protein n=1 Tax=Marinomonas sp. TI.3.20 TaxID=3121296 RepID=UPI00312036D8
MVHCLFRYYRFLKNTQIQRKAVIGAKCLRIAYPQLLVKTLPRSLFLVLFILTGTVSYADTTQTPGSVIGVKASEFYKPSRMEDRTPANFASGWNANGADTTADSQKLQQAIDAVSASGGGAISIPAGHYTFGNVQLKSNVHLMIDHAATIVPALPVNHKSAKIFILDGHVSNVSIQGVGGRFHVELPAYKPGVMVFQINAVKNFYIANVSITDSQTKFASLSMGPGRQKTSGPNWPTVPKNLRLSPNAPRDGVVENIDQTHASAGYGIVQVQAGEHLLFRNLSTEGGVALRVETGEKAMNDAQVGGVDQIYGRDLTCRNGFATLMLQPHSMHDGTVDVDGVTSKGCEFAVAFRPGFVSHKSHNPNLTLGSFTSVSVNHVDASFGAQAQLPNRRRGKMDLIPSYMMKYVPQAIRDQPGYGGEFYIGPALAAVLNDGTSYESAIHIKNVTAHGLLARQPTITPKAVHKK